MRENQHPHANHSLYLSTFFCPSSIIFTPPMTARVSNFVYTYRGFKCVVQNKQQKHTHKKKKHDLSSFFIFSFLSISYSNVMHKKFVKDLSGTVAPRILKFGTNIEYDLLYCVKENQHPHAYHSLYLSFFFSNDFCHRFSSFF